MRVLNIRPKNGVLTNQHWQLIPTDMDLSEKKWGYTDQENMFGPSKYLDLVDPRYPELQSQYFHPHHKGCHMGCIPVVQ